MAWLVIPRCELDPDRRRSIGMELRITDLKYSVDALVDYPMLPNIYVNTSAVDQSIQSPSAMNVWTLKMLGKPGSLW